MFRSKVSKKTVGCLMALTMVMTNSYMGINVGGRVENVAYAEEELTYTVGNSTYYYKYCWDYDENGVYKITDNLAITKCVTSDNEVTFPDTIDGKKVIAIYGNAWQSGVVSECENLKKVIIPGGISSIGKYAFYNCSNLEDVVLESGISYIGESAFRQCYNLKSITIPNGVTSIDSWLFAECFCLQEINLPETLIKIGYNAFSFTGIESIKIPENVRKIEGYAFYRCENLKDIYIPKNVSEMGYGYSEYTPTMGMFAGCYNLNKISVSEENQYYKSYDNSIYTADGKELIQYNPSETSVRLLNGIERIGAEAFYLTKIDNIILPDSINSIGWRAFAYCSNLTSIEIPNSVTSIGENAFYRCNNLSIYGKEDSIAEEYAKNNNIPFVRIITLLDNVTNVEVAYSEDSIGKAVFLKSKQLTVSDEEYKNIILTDKITDATVKPEDVIFTAYDISLVDENNSLVQPTGTVTVKIPCPAYYNGENCKVYRVGGAGEFTDMNAKYQNGYMVFETDHFSTYIITETELVTKVDYISGDANGDGNMDIKDSAIIKRYLAGWDVEIDMTAADMDGDGKVTIKDSALIKRQLAGWE